MNCIFHITGDIHSSNRQLMRCSRTGCSRKGLLPPSGKTTDLQAECRGTPAWHEFGNIAELLLQVIGITKARWSWLIGHSDGCVTCDQRQETLNTIGHRLAQSTKWYAKLFVQWFMTTKPQTRTLPRPQSHDEVSQPD